MNQPQLQSALYYIYVFSLFLSRTPCNNMISGLWAHLLYLMIISGSGSNLANKFVVMFSTNKAEFEKRMIVLPLYFWWYVWW
jgi:hypothetical protein